MKKLIIPLFFCYASIMSKPIFPPFLFNKLKLHLWQHKISHQKSFCSMLDVRHILEPVTKHAESDQKTIFGHYLGLELLVKKSRFYKNTLSKDVINKAHTLLQEIEKDTHLNSAKKRFDTTIKHDFETTFHQENSIQDTLKERHLNGLQMNCIELCLQEIKRTYHAQTNN